MVLKVDLFPQIQKKEIELQRRVTSREIAEAAGIAESTLSTYRTGSVTMVYLPTIEKLMNYFGCEAGDLLRRSE